MLIADSLALKLCLMVYYKETASQRNLQNITKQLDHGSGGCPLERERKKNAIVSLFSGLVSFFSPPSAYNQSVFCFAIHGNMKRHVNRWLCCRHFPFIFSIDFFKRWSKNRKVSPVFLEVTPKGLHRLLKHKTL